MKRDRHGYAQSTERERDKSCDQDAEKRDAAVAVNLHPC